MHRKKRHILISLLIVVIFSCQKEDAIDKEVDTDLIGRWSNGLHQYSFYENGTYNFLVVNRRNADSLGLTLPHDSVVGDFYTISNKSLVFEPKLGRKLSDNSIVNFDNITPQVVNYSVNNQNRLTFNSSSVELELAKDTTSL